MKKAVKIIAGVLLGLIALVVVLLLAHPLWLAPTAKGIANSMVPGVTGTEFNLGKLTLNGYSGEFSVGELLLGNPEGYDERIALKVGSVSVTADMSSVASDVIRLKEVTIKDVFVSYVSKDGVNNFDRISKNVSGDGADAESVKSESSDDGAENAEPAKVEDEKPGKRVIIEKLSLSGVTVKLGPVPLPVPPITLTGIGEKSGGVTLVELGNQLMAVIIKGVGSLKDGLGALGALAGDGASALGAITGDGVDTLKKQIEKGDVKAVRESVEDTVRKSGDAVKEAAGALKSLFK